MKQLTAIPAEAIVIFFINKRQAINYMYKQTKVKTETSRMISLSLKSNEIGHYHLNFKYRRQVLI